jgi:KTSC domain
MPRVRLHPVDSTCVARLGYDEAAEEVLVEFHDSGLYGYRPVPPEVYAEFEHADSKGTFLNQVIKPRYPVRKLRE